MNTSTAQQLHRDCLVAVVASDQDLRRFTEEYWYRIPERAIGRSLGDRVLDEITFLAPYQTSTITGGIPGAIEIWGEVAEILCTVRRDIIPAEPDHPAANQSYRLVRLKNIQRLERPIISRRPRRVTFIRTTGERLLHASDINDLIIGSAVEERLWERLREFGAERKYYLQSGGIVMEVDFAIFSPQTTLGVICSEQEECEDTGIPGTWRVLRFSPTRLELDFARCVEDILRGLGQE